MKKNELIRNEEKIYRVLDEIDNMLLVIDCIKKTMPVWEKKEIFSGYVTCSEEELWHMTGYSENRGELTANQNELMHKRFTIIAEVLGLIGDISSRSVLIGKIAEENSISKQSVRGYLCLYLTYMSIFALVPKEKNNKRELTSDEKNIRWSLNKYFYTQKKLSLKASYTMMLKKKYCNMEGNLVEPYPTFYQYRYFYRKTRKLENYYISREGKTAYQRNYRPLLGDKVQEYAGAPGVGMVDGTVLDIYLINDSGELVGRPLMTACVDTYSGICMGYSLTWEGGVYSLRQLMLNVITDKVFHCRKFGIDITENEWPSNKMPGKIVSDQGSEYVSETFSQIAEMGITIVNLPPYRPELKGPVEQFFDQVQEKFKPYLKGKGVIEPDYQERGAHDYRKDGCLTLHQFEKILLHCIIYCNAHRIIENFPYTDEMLQNNIKPHPADIWIWGMKQQGTNLLDISKEKLILYLLPRAEGTFNRSGLKVNQLRYHHAEYKEMYLKGGTVTVAYNPETTNYVWVIEKGEFIRFELIDSQYVNMDLESVEDMRDKHKQIKKSLLKTNTQAQIDLISHIEAIASEAVSSNQVSVKNIRDNKSKEIMRTHEDMVRRNIIDE